MSRTYCIACLTCRKRLWIGQGWPSRPDDRYIYSYPEATKALSDFLYAHGRTGATGAEGHDHILVFSDDEWREVADLEKIELPNWDAAGERSLVKRLEEEKGRYVCRSTSNVSLDGDFTMEELRALLLVMALDRLAAKRRTD